MFFDLESYGDGFVRSFWVKKEKEKQRQNHKLAKRLKELIQILLVMSNKYLSISVGEMQLG